MAITIQPYNHTLRLFLAGQVTTAGLKVTNLNASAVFDATDTTITEVTNAGAYEVSGNGWDAGGEPLANEAVTTVSTSGAKLDADDISVTASGGTIGPAEAGLLHDGTYPLAFIDYDGAQQATAGAPFIITWPAGGILTLAWAA